MASKHICTDANYAWPIAEIAVTGPEGAVNIVYRRELEKSDNPGAERAAKIEELRDRFANPYVAAERLCGRRHPPLRHPQEADPGARDAGKQARQKPTQKPARAERHGNGAETLDRSLLL